MKGSGILILLWSFSCIRCLEINVNDSDFDGELVNCKERKASPYYRKFELYPIQGFRIQKVTSDEEIIWECQPDETLYLLTMFKLKFLPVVVVLDINGSVRFYYKQKNKWNKTDFYLYSRLYDQINSDHGSFILDIEKQYSSPLASVERYNMNEYFVVDFFSKLRYFISKVKYKSDFVFDPNKINSQENVSQDLVGHHEENNYICSFVRLSHNSLDTFIEIVVESNVEEEVFYFWKGKHGWISIGQSEYRRGINHWIKPVDTSKEPHLTPNQLQTESPNTGSTSGDQQVWNRDKGTNLGSEISLPHNEDEAGNNRARAKLDSEPNQFLEDSQKSRINRYLDLESIKSGPTGEEFVDLKTGLKKQRETKLNNDKDKKLSNHTVKEITINNSKKLRTLKCNPLKSMKGCFILRGKGICFLLLMATILIVS